MSRPSAKRQALREAMAAAAMDGWHIIDGRTIRWDREQPFPEHMRDWTGPHGGTPYAGFGPTYRQSVFVTYFETGQPITRVCLAPWVEARDQQVTLTQALAVLANPQSALGP